MENSDLKSARQYPGVLFFCLGVLHRKACDSSGSFDGKCSSYLDHGVLPVAVITGVAQGPGGV